MLVKSDDAEPSTRQFIAEDERMELVEPEWHLAGRCSCLCGGEGQVLLVACQQCGRVIGVCSEVGSIYFDLGNTRGEPAGNWVTEPEQKCPGCGKEPVSSFKPATWELIQAAGFEPGQYC